MVRQRPSLGTPFGTDGPWLAAILDTLNDLHDLMEERLPLRGSDGGGGPVRISEPAPAGPPVPVAEPAPGVPAEDDRDDEDPPLEVSEPARDLPPIPPRAGRGSSLEAWRAFADAAGVRYDGDASRDDVIAACEFAKVVPTK